VNWIIFRRPQSDDPWQRSTGLITAICAAVVTTFLAELARDGEHGCGLGGPRNQKHRETADDIWPIRENYVASRTSQSTSTVKWLERCRYSSRTLSSELFIFLPG
jgi:hypothetical protein